jgi:hypothetical protein
MKSPYDLCARCRHWRRLHGYEWRLGKGVVGCFNGADLTNGIKLACDCPKFVESDP